MDYTGDEALYPGASFGEDGGDYRVELDALDLSQTGEEEGEKTPRDLLEARFAAGRIQTLLEEGFPVVGQNGGQRPVSAGDIVILLRSPGAVLHHYARALGERDIPWEAEGGEDFLDSTEVSVALSYLQIIDNPRQDVPLISVLRSTAFRRTGSQRSGPTPGTRTFTRRCAGMRAGTRPPFWRSWNCCGTGPWI